MGVAAVDEDVARFEVRGDHLDGVVHRLPGLHQDDDLARALDAGDELLGRGGADELLALAAPADELLHLVGAAVVHGDGVPAGLHVEDEVLAHHGESHETDVGGRCGHCECPCWW